VIAAMPSDRDARHAAGADRDPAVVVDGAGLLCVRLLLKLRGALAAVRPGTLVHVITTDPGTHPPTHARRVAEAPRPTRPDRPWHPL
jgi:tRNA 2-thiouridine synthesizing protein A